MSWTWWNATTHISSKSVHWEASYGISNILQHSDRPPFWILKILIFDYVTVVMVLICCCVPNFIKIGSRVRPPGAHNCRMFNAPLPWQPHHGGNVMGCDHPSFVAVGPLVGELWHFQYFPTWRYIFWTTHEVNYVVRLPCQNLVLIQYSPPEILRFYNFASLAEKCLTTPPFWVVFWGFEPL